MGLQALTAMAAPCALYGYGGNSQTASTHISSRMELTSIGWHASPSSKMRFDECTHSRIGGRSTSLRLLATSTSLSSFMTLRQTEIRWIQNIIRKPAHLISQPSKPFLITSGSVATIHDSLVYSDGSPGRAIAKWYCFLPLCKI